MGERIGREHDFKGHPRRELTAIQRHVVVGDPDDPDGDVPVPDATRRTAAHALASHLGLAGPDVAARREQARAQRDRVLAAQQLARGGRLAIPTMESRRRSGRPGGAKPPGTGQLVRAEDGVSGSLPIYRRA